MQPNERKIKLEMPTDPSGTYANTVMISNNQQEVFFDFIQISPHDPRAKVQRRIVMTPMHAKLFLMALQENVQRYEDKFGEIPVPARPQSLADQLFKNLGGNPEDNDDNE